MHGRDKTIPEGKSGGIKLSYSTVKNAILKPYEKDNKSRGFCFPLTAQPVILRNPREGVAGARLPVYIIDIFTQKTRT